MKVFNRNFSKAARRLRKTNWNGTSESNKAIWGPPLNETIQENPDLKDIVERVEVHGDPHMSTSRTDGNKSYHLTLSLYRSNGKRIGGKAHFKLNKKLSFNKGLRFLDPVKVGDRTKSPKRSPGKRPGKRLGKSPKKSTRKDDDHQRPGGGGNKRM